MPKKIIVLILLIMLVMPVWAKKARGKGVTFFAPGSVYVYLQGSWVYINPDYFIYDSKENAFAPVFGVGCRVIDFGNSMFMNLEFDFSQVTFDSEPGYTDKRVRFYNFKLGGEFLFFHNKLGLLTNIGIGNITYPDRYDYGYDGNSELTLLLELGIKIAMTKHLNFRTDCRFFTEPDTNLYDDYYYYGDDDSRLIGFTLAVGLQYNF